MLYFKLILKFLLIPKWTLLFLLQFVVAQCIIEFIYLLSLYLFFDLQRYNLFLRANVIVPDVVISMERVDFGPVLCGHCMFIYVCLSNNKAVECDWEARFFKTAKDSNCFKVEPESGKF